MDKFIFIVALIIAVSGLMIVRSDLMQDEEKIKSLELGYELKEKMLEDAYEDINYYEEKVDTLQNRIDELEDKLKEKESELTAQGVKRLDESEGDDCLDGCGGVERLCNYKSVERLGKFDLTYYCPCARCCGKTDGVTASGTQAIDGVTVASDWDVIPPGTKVFIDGIGERIVEDRGGKVNGNHIDIYVENHEKALAQKIRKADVYIIDEKDGEDC